MYFSVVVPVYNVEKYIGKCIDSIVSQTFQDWELLLIDDGSSDRSTQICREYADKDSRVHLFEKKNGGPSAARNDGVRRASGDYLIFTDSDDYMAEDSLEQMYHVCQEYHRPDIVLSEGSFLVSGEHIEERRFFEKKHYQGISGREAALKTMAVAPNWAVFGKCYRLAYWKERGFAFSEGRLGEDLELIDRVVLEAESVVMIPSYYYYRLSRGDSLTSRINKKQKYDDLLALVSWEKYFKERQTDRQVQDAFRKMTMRLYCYEILGNAYLFEGGERKRFLELARPLLFYLDYGEKPGIRCLRAAVKCFGLETVCMFWGKIRTVRRRRMEKA